MLLISSMMTTVLPTPAPPNAPTLPPFRKGQIKSMTLMPVASTCGEVDWSTSRGAGRWIGIIFLRLDRPAFVHRVAAHIEDAAHHAFADGHGNGRAGVDDFVAALETFGAGHGDRPDPVVAEVLLHFERQFDRLVLDFVIRRSARCRCRAVCP